ncbi:MULTISPECIES: SMR family transporter [unclassified Leifsonia]|uniref:DMT family transporter n=1 Tax=unclassified Leifsonia TaxID=2663824 RepID=UPI0008A7AB7A|nr:MULTISPECIES: SMR family transporter [unclassified Leifsonia]SEI14687.1 small multidrug resistance pump [Leifsonia sp. CL154]SFM02409.1 small multidrug resistance pump [Leifsonia sp. CL147]
MAWLFLVGAIATEVGATISLRAAISANWKWYIPVTVGYLAAFALLSSALSHGIGIGIAYGIWAASGVAITSVLSRLIFKEPLTLIMSAGIVLIMGGVLLVELGSVR